ncbi:MAG TPA: hypothetical protein IAA29_02875 [Candidatus Paenibacillus intestinavium]|nr:hypothetical protein [Candidatus Paenibacillus intestinavium]
MKRIFTTFLLLNALLILGGCSSGNSDKPFMAWMDAYIAVEVNTEQQIAATLYSKNKLSLQSEDIITMQFIGAQQQLAIQQYRVIENTDPITSYHRYDIIIHYKALETGQYETSGIEITTLSMPTMSLLIGTWHFDVNDAPSEAIQSWNSPGAFSNNEKLPYDYNSSNDATLLTSIQYSKHSTIENKDGLPLAGSIDIKQDYNAPFVYIRTKIHSNHNNLTSLDYGNGIYLLSQAPATELIEISREHNQLK